MDIKNIDLQKYDFKRENDKDFLREAGMLMQEELIKLKFFLEQQNIQKLHDDNIISNLSGQLIKLRKLVFEKKQEKKQKAKDQKKRKRKKGQNLVHNQNENKAVDEDKESQLVADEVVHELEEDHPKCCDNCDLIEILKLQDESSEITISESFYILKRHIKKKYKCQNCESIVTAKGPDKLVPGVPLDNTIVERLLKTPILNRKNSYFYKTQFGAFVGDMMMSLIETCKATKVNPQKYLLAIHENREWVKKEPKAWLPWNFESNF